MSQSSPYDLYRARSPHSCYQCGQLVVNATDPYSLCRLCEILSMRPQYAPPGPVPGKLHPILTAPSMIESIIDWRDDEVLQEYLCVNCPDTIYEIDHGWFHTADAGSLCANGETHADPGEEQ